jgi:hypothetical protein
MASNAGAAVGGAGAGVGGGALSRPTAQATTVNRSGTQPYWWAPLLCADPALVADTDAAAAADAATSSAAGSSGSAPGAGAASSALRALVAEALSSASSSGGNTPAGAAAGSAHPLSAYRDLICRKVTLAPTYGGPVTRLIPLPRRLPPSAATGAGAGVLGVSAGAAGGRRFGLSDYVLYACDEKIIGLMRLPLTGDPERSMALIAHPGSITALAPTCDGRSVLTAGGRDRTVLLWGVNTAALDAAMALSAAAAAGARPQDSVTGDPTTDTFLQLVTEGAAEGLGAPLRPGGAETPEAVYEELVDAFYHSQLRAEGLHKSGRRAVTGRIPVSEAVVMMRALGFFPSEDQVQQIHCEVAWDHFGADDGAAGAADAAGLGAGAGAGAGGRRALPVQHLSQVKEESVTLREVIRLLANHRPVFELHSDALTRAVAVLAGAAAPADGPDAGATAGGISRAALAELLLAAGERMSEKELRMLLHVLQSKGALPTPTPASVGAAALAKPGARAGAGVGSRPGMFGGRGRVPAPSSLSRTGAGAGAGGAEGLNPLTSPLSAYLPDLVDADTLRGASVLGLDKELAAQGARDLGYAGAVWGE